MMSEFAEMWDDRLGAVRRVKHRIKTDPADAGPIISAPYRDWPKEQELEKEEIGKLVSMNMKKPAQSKWASPIILVLKKDGSLRFCVDYCRLNQMKVRDSYPISTLGNAEVFETLDANSGYWKRGIDNRERDKTAFTSHHGR